MERSDLLANSTSTTSIGRFATWSAKTAGWQRAWKVLFSSYSVSAVNPVAETVSLEHGCCIANLIPA